MRIGVFGGTFDPVHDGHVLPVAAAAAKFQLDGCSTSRPGSRRTRKSAPTDARHRVAMLALAIAGRPDWSIDLEELDRQPPSFTIDTLRAIAARHPDDELWLLMGTDILAGFARWREPEAILGPRAAGGIPPGAVRRARARRARSGGPRGSVGDFRRGIG